MPNTEFHHTLEPDQPVTLNAGYQLDATDRRFVDEQIRQIQTMLAALLVAGRQGTYFELDASSAAVAAGDNVCVSPNSTTAQVVTKATGAALSIAGRPCGVVLEGAQPGTKVRVATFGTLPPSVTGLGASQGLVRVNATTARCEKVTLLSGGDYPVGYVDTAGNLTLGLGDAYESALPSGDAGKVLYYNGGWTASPLLYLVGSLMQFRSDIVGPTITQAYTSSHGDGEKLTVQAQHGDAGSGEDGDGGDLHLLGGDGDGHGGDAVLGGGFGSTGVGSAILRSGDGTDRLRADTAGLDFRNSDTTNTHRWEGDPTYIPDGGTSTELALDGSAVSLPLATLLPVGHGCVFGAECWISDLTGNAYAVPDQLNFFIYRSEIDGEVRLGHLDKEDGDTQVAEMGDVQISIDPTAGDYGYLVRVEGIDSTPVLKIRRLNDPLYDGYGHIRLWRRQSRETYKP